MFKQRYLQNILTAAVLVIAGITNASTAIAASVDPTKPFGHSGFSSSGVIKNKLVLQSIIHGDGLHTAVINGKVLKPGESIGQYKLVAVNDTSVVLRSETKRLKLHVFKRKIFK